jgi:aldehyde:ferredoxin oxidoreductase
MRHGSGSEAATLCCGPIDMIGSREGLGNLLAEGSRRAAHKIGHNSIAIAPQVRGLEIPAMSRGRFRPWRSVLPWGRAARITIAGARTKSTSRTRSNRRHVTLDAVRHAIDTEDRAVLMDSLIICKFCAACLPISTPKPPRCCGMLPAGTSTPTNCAKRPSAFVSAKGQFNLLAGWTPAEDTLPERLLSRPPPNDSEAMLSR